MIAENVSVYTSRAVLCRGRDRPLPGLCVRRCRM